jgi:hypothetical protein
MRSKRMIGFCGLIALLMFWGGLQLVAFDAKAEVAGDPDAKAEVAGDPLPLVVSTAEPRTCDNPPLRDGEVIRTLGCANEGKYLAMMRAEHPNRDWLIVDVGVNKGYVIGSCLMALGALGDLNPSIYRSAVQYAAVHGNSRSHLCGTCGNCHENRSNHGDGSPVRSARVVGFDINGANVKFVNQFYASQSAPMIPFPFKVDVQHCGLAAEASQMSVCRFPFGYTLGTLSRTCNETDTISVVTLNDKFSDERIDYLVIDTEGHDYLVAAGASLLFERGQVRMMQIELHGRNIRFEDFVNRMWKYRYVTFLIVDGNVRDLIEVSGPCWTSVFNVAGWQNALCVHSDEVALLRRLRGKKK